MTYSALDYYDAARNDELGPSFMSWVGAQIGIATTNGGGVYVWHVGDTTHDLTIPAADLDPEEFLDRLDAFAETCEVES